MTISADHAAPADQPRSDAVGHQDPGSDAVRKFGITR